MGIDKLRSTGGMGSKRYGICKLCRLGMFTGGEPSMWLKNPPNGVSPGLVHVSCAKDAGLAP